MELRGFSCSLVSSVNWPEEAVRTVGDFVFEVEFIFMTALPRGSS